jgi:hypothetical protein
MEKKSCGSAGCQNPSEVLLDGRPLCRNHFYEIAAKRLEDIRLHFVEGGPSLARNSSEARFLSELIGAATGLVATARYLSELHRDKYLELSLSALELYNRLQRHPRFAKEIVVILRRTPDPGARKEFTKTLNVSKKGGCIETGSVWNVSDDVWIERADNRQQARARIVWVKHKPSSRYLLGVEILDCQDFWRLERSSPSKRVSRSDG